MQLCYSTVCNKKVAVNSLQEKLLKITEHILGAEAATIMALQHAVRYGKIKPAMHRGVQTIAATDMELVRKLTDVVNS